MAILVDEAIWQWRGQRWAHLVSDQDFGELHAFAETLGLRRVGFQGDHYDVETSTRRRAIDLGAVEISSRDLVRRLRSSGLRYRGSASWTSTDLEPFDDLEALRERIAHLLDDHPDSTELDLLLHRSAELVLRSPLRVLHRPFECAVIVETATGPVDLVAGERHSRRRR